MNWKDDQRRTGEVCIGCGRNEAQAEADARAVGVGDEFRAGAYSCCQVAAWADEQWLAWRAAAFEDGKSVEEATRPLEVDELEWPLIPVRLKKPLDTDL